MCLCRCSRRLLLLLVAVLSIGAWSMPVLAQCQVEKLTATEGGPGDNFGYAASHTHGHVVVGAPFDGHAGESSGSAYVFRRDDNGTLQDASDDFWVQQSRLVAGDADEYDEFGVTVAIAGDHIVVGAPSDPEDTSDPGSAHVFRRDDNGTSGDPTDDTWVEEAILSASVPAAGDEFGHSVAINGDRIIVGSIYDFVPGVGPDAGSAHIFRRDDGGTSGDPSDDTWVEEDWITASDALPYDRFGASVSIHGRYAVVGAPFDINQGFDPGSAHVFYREDNDTAGDPTDDDWVEVAVLEASDGQWGDLFGQSVSISGNFIAVGAVWDDDAGSRSGSVYAYRRDDNATPANPYDDTWLEQAKLTASDAAEHDWFGFRVSRQGNYVAVSGLFNDDAGESSGSFYVFGRDDNGTPGNLTDDSWTQRAKLTSTDLTAGDHFGVSVSMSGVYAVAGAHGDDDGGSAAGAAYVFRLLGEPDCNTNVLNDACDIAGGTSTDVDSNGIPDECQNAVPTMSARGMVGMAILLGAAGVVLVSRARRIAA